MTVVEPCAIASDDDRSLRPRTLAEFTGQRQVCDHLRVVLGSARQRGQVAEHVLFVGPPGLGKTTLAAIVAQEQGASLRQTSAPAFTKAGDLAALVTSLAEGDVLFIDEIHHLPRPIEEVLYGVMEDFHLDVTVGEGSTVRTVRLPLPRFTLVAATTKLGLLSRPLRDRFGLVAHLELYDVADLAAIVARSASVLGLAIDAEACTEVAMRSRGTPRIANRLLHRVRDYAWQMRGADVAVSVELARDALAYFGVDRLGLDVVDRAILNALVRVFAGRPVGLAALAAAVGEEPRTIEDVHEPYLLRAGLVQRTPQGRKATTAALRHVRSGGS